MKMRIALSAQQNNLQALIDPRFGRAQFFILYDTETGDFTVHNNDQNLNAVQGAGIQAAQNVARLGADAVITGHVGPKAFNTLQAAGIKVYVGVAGDVQTAIAAYRAGKFHEVKQPDVAGHWT
jgi:predicted Fe-Mo cluster-binding NifX family protein